MRFHKYVLLHHCKCTYVCVCVCVCVCFSYLNLLGNIIFVKHCVYKTKSYKLFKFIDLNALSVVILTHFYQFLKIFLFQLFLNSYILVWCFFSFGIN